MYYSRPATVQDAAAQSALYLLHKQSLVLYASHAEDLNASLGLYLTDTSLWQPQIELRWFSSSPSPH